MGDIIILIDEINHSENTNNTRSKLGKSHQKSIISAPTTDRDLRKNCFYFDIRNWRKQETEKCQQKANFWFKTAIQWMQFKQTGKYLGK